MMSVKIMAFGTNWWVRFGSNPQDPWCFTRHTAYYNSAGLRCGTTVRRHWTVPGLVRFNGVGDFNSHLPSRSIRQTFLCPGLEVARGGKRLLLASRARQVRTPDRYLVVLSSDRHGMVDFAYVGPGADSVLCVAVSQLHGRQEGLLLMEPGSWIRSSLGYWQLRVHPKLPNGAALTLAGDAALG